MSAGNNVTDNAVTDPPTAVWKTLREPFLTIYQDGIDRSRDGLIRVLTLISNSCRDKKNWYIPLKPAQSQRELGPLQDEEYTAFCTWLLGRLFYFLQMDSISDIHQLCVDAQVQILHLASENEFMFRFFFQEYLSTLTDLLHIQECGTLFQEGPLLLKRFNPQPLDSLAELNLMPKYVLIHTYSLLKSMEKYLVQIIASMIPSVKRTGEEFVTELWLTMCKLLRIAPPDVKVQVLGILMAIIKNLGSFERLAVADMCRDVENVVKILPHLKSQAGAPSHILLEIRRAVVDLFEVMIEFSESRKDDSRDCQFLAVLLPLVTSWESDNSSGTVLASASQCIMKLLQKLPPRSVDVESCAALLNKSQTQMLSVDILEIRLVHELLEDLKHKQQNTSDEDNSQIIKVSPVMVCVVSSSSAWAMFHQQLMNDLSVVKDSLIPNEQEGRYIQARNLIAKIQVLVRCTLGTDILLAKQKETQTQFYVLDFFEGQTGDILIYLKEILIQIRQIMDESSDIFLSVVRSVIYIVGSIMLLPMMEWNSADVVMTGVSILALPWLDCGDLYDLQLDASIILLHRTINFSKWECLKGICLRALAHVPHGIASQWRASLFSSSLNNITLSSSRHSHMVAAEALRSFPALLSDPSQNPAELMDNIIVPLLNSEDPLIQTHLSDVFSSLICVLAGDYVSVRVKGSDGEFLFSHICKTCHKDARRFSAQGRNYLCNAKNLVNCFNVLLESPVMEVRRNMAASLSSLVLHLPAMYQPDMVIKWLKYAQDPDCQVRVTFSRKVKFLIFHRDWIEGKEVESEHLREELIPLTQVDRVELLQSRPRLSRVLPLLFQALETHLQNSRHGFVNTLLATIVDIGCVPLDCVLKPVLKMLVVCVSHPNFRNPAVAHVYLKQIADAHNTKVEKLYRRFQSHLCQDLIALVSMNFHLQPNWITFMDKVLFGFGYHSVADWMRESANYILPVIIPMVVKNNDESFLKMVLDVMRLDPGTMVRNFFQHIFPHVFLNEKDEVVEKCVVLMESMSQLSAQDLLIKSFKTIHNVLLLHYHCKKDRVYEGICRLINVLGKSESTPCKPSYSTAEIAEHLNPRFLGVLVHFDDALAAASSEEEIKIKALQSLPEIIKLLGPKYITPVRFKVLSTLRTALRLTHCDFPHLSCSAWEAFIHSVELGVLGPLLGTIVAALLPLVDQFPDEISGILQWLVVDHETDLALHIPQLFFLPNKPPITNVYQVVQRYIDSQKKDMRENQNVAELLKQHMPFISHDNVDIRHHALEHLCLILSERQDEIIKGLLREESVHPDIAQLLSALVVGCRDPDTDIQLLCVENLGLLGALDPGHLPRHIHEDDTRHIFTNIESDKFGCQALTVLAKAYHAARHTRNMDAFALAIQEMLKFYNISSNPRHPKKHLWESFPDNIQQVMIPLEDSCYIMTSNEDFYVWPHPLFGTRYASSLPRWAHSWACRLLTFIDPSPAKKVLSSCSLSLRTDIKCVLFFLPFVLLYALFSGNEENHKMMAEEMTFILQQRRLDDYEKGRTHVSNQTKKSRMCTDKSTSVPKVVDSDSATTHALCAKTVFSLLDFLEKWVGWAKKQGNENGGRKEKQVAEEKIQNVHRFISRFSKLDLAYGNYSVKEFARALMYLEDYLMEQPDQIKDHLSFLGRIYAVLNDADGIKGVQALLMNQPSVLETIVYHEVTGQHQEALACYELLAQQHGMNELGLHVQKGMVQCYLSLDQPNAALRIAKGVMSDWPESSSSLLEHQAECFWRIQSLDNLEAVLKDPRLEESSAWGVSIGRCLVDIRHNHLDQLTEHLRQTRASLAKILSTTTLEQGSYRQGYPHILKLHMLQEIESAGGVIAQLRSLNSDEKECLSAIKHLIQVWEERLGMVQMVASVQEPLLRLRRCVLQIALSCVRPEHENLAVLLNKELGQSWLKSAEVAHIASCFQQSYIYLLNAEKYKPKRHFIKLAELYWVKGMHEQAFSALRRGVEEHFPNWKELSKSDFPSDELKICAEAKLLIARYNDDSLNVGLELNIANYREAVEVCRNWENSHFSLAQYYDRVPVQQDESLRDCSSYADFQFFAVISYGRSMRYGCAYIYQSMSRMLSIWLDYGKRYQDALASSSFNPSTMSKTDLLNQAKTIKERKTVLDRMNEYISGFVDTLPPYTFMTGFSQLVSRICHPVVEVYDVIKSIIAKLLTCFPQQTMWMLLVIHRSSYTLRRSRCQTILEDPRIRKTAELVQLTADFTKLGSLLSDLCHKAVPQLTKTSVSLLVKNLPKVLADPKFSEIMVPLQCYRTLILPKPDYSSLQTHRPYAVKPPSISGIKDEVIVLNSLQRPRKITLIGSDGKNYEMMCKDKDDLRLDARVMEFNSIVNKYLQKDPASRSRSLSIRTYSVVPLNEASGLIEWVPNLAGYRIIVTQIYKEMGCHTTTKEIRKHVLDKRASLEEKRAKYLNELIPLHPPVFRHWFRNNFTDSRSWYEARKSYIHTTAVMSMVGYILGLGDRHGENILLDTTCGDVVHVDFNCLFNTGETFECPERVPFRLTHNMVSAMGPTGVEGSFRHACEITLRVLRDWDSTLLSVLRPFVYDPLVTWSRKIPVVRKADQAEMTNDLAVENVKNIELRLRGLAKKGALQLSVEGHTAALIQEATSIDNLCQMYIGWGAYI